MDGVVVWTGFLGSWLLFMGPLYQAALELVQENELRDRLGAARTESRDQVSAWWWLLPPVHLVLQRHRSKVFRKRVVHTLDPDLVQDLIVYLNAATGWLYVGLGGLLIAVSETGELVRHEHWSPAVFVGLSIVMAFLSTANVAVRIRRGRSIVVRSRTTGSQTDERWPQAAQSEP